MTAYWLSWWHPHTVGEFDLSIPWWISQTSVEGEQAICAALRARDDAAALENIFASYDARPRKLEFRFIEPKPPEWSPFTKRFPREHWMQWSVP